ncbi:MAG: Lrp/AsnC family transcriptional regulator [Pseudomonadota bacterium]
MQLSDPDRKLLRALQREPDLNASELAAQLVMTAAQVTRRLDRLQEVGVITGRHAVINWAQLGYTVEVSLRITLDKTNSRAFDDFLEAARKIPEVLEIQTFLGRVDVRLHLIAKDMAGYQTLYRDRILTLPHIADIEALMQVASIQDEGALPI